MYHVNVYDVCVAKGCLHVCVMCIVYSTYRKYRNIPVKKVFVQNLSTIIFTIQVEFKF